MSQKWLLLKVILIGKSGTQLFCGLLVVANFKKLMTILPGACKTQKSLSGWYTYFLYFTDGQSGDRNYMDATAHFTLKH